jgi:hypothetical protein
LIGALRLRARIAPSSNAAHGFIQAGYFKEAQKTFLCQGTEHRKSEITPRRRSVPQDPKMSDE